ncbi:hypothetical protein PILCRDRAFT_604604 [Piloderma croceum F 1598]|uniref:Uncharacterized protein n=1 Tax=Piloderma croceum (strain F 1598) TaxID=765440 RepID=A0A0C3AV74_PILCF|nr:hypothetical protein PILCRDRAFT_604604 [Piloderma croceum F 1598]
MFTHCPLELSAAYNRPFLGNTATDFVNSLLNTGDDIRHDSLPIYARAISILQSSGTGKSRLLTEVGKQTFTLPICLRNPNDPGYPPSDAAVYHYFAQLTTDNDMSFTAHSAIASFLAAAHKTMLEWLQEAQRKYDFDGPQLHEWWYNLMEQSVREGERHFFFEEVLRKANTVSHWFLTFQIIVIR